MDEAAFKKVMMALGNGAANLTRGHSTMPDSGAHKAMVALVVAVREGEVGLLPRQVHSAQWLQTYNAVLSGLFANPEGYHDENLTPSKGREMAKDEADAAHGARS